MRKAIEQSQKESMMLYQKNLVQNELYDNTPDYMIDGTEDNTGSIDLGFFDQLNNFNSNGYGF